MKQIFILASLFFISFGAQAFPCYVTLVKDSCWVNYNVTVTVLDSYDKKTLATAIVPTGSSWTRQKFNCKPGQNLMFEAKFTPVFWQGDEGKNYLSLHHWNLPQAVSGDETAWNITVCFAKQFAAVPLPPDAHGKCVCNMDKIPPIEPE